MHRNLNKPQLNWIYHIHAPHSWTTNSNHETFRDRFVIIIIKISNSARCVVTVMMSVKTISVIYSSQINSQIQDWKLIIKTFCNWKLNVREMNIHDKEQRPSSRHPTVDSHVDHINIEYARNISSDSTEKLKLL